MTRLFITAMILLTLASAAHAFGLGSLGVRFGGLGSIGKSKATALVSCASTGIFNLSNVCNDVYFIGAMK